jgi:hypothetical protein
MIFQVQLLIYSVQRRLLHIWMLHKHIIKHINNLFHDLRSQTVFVQILLKNQLSCIFSQFINEIHISSLEHTGVVECIKEIVRIVICTISIIIFIRTLRDINFNFTKSSENHQRHSQWQNICHHIHLRFLAFLIQLMYICIALSSRSSQICSCISSCWAV